MGAGFLALTIHEASGASPGISEMFMLILLGFTCIATLSGHGKRGLLLGLLSGILGFMCSLVGQDKQAGILRFTFDLLYLWEGLPLVPVMIGLFAIPEVVDLAVRGTGIASQAPRGKLGKGAMEGIKDTFRHFGLTIRCSIIGSIAGIIPGLGGGSSQWLSYAHARGSARNEEERDGFGKGDVRGPGAGGITTQGRRKPDSYRRVRVLRDRDGHFDGGFLLLGLVPVPIYSQASCPDLFNGLDHRHCQHYCGGICLLFINHLAKLTLVRGNLMIPVILLFCFIGTYMASETIGDLIVLLIFEPWDVSC